MFEALAKPFFAEGKAEPGSDKITCVGESILMKIMCAPKTATQAEVEAAAGYAGTSRGWQAATEDADCCVECKDDSTRQHWKLLC